jgi:hypothetical protein
MVSTDLFGEAELSLRQYCKTTTKVIPDAAQRDMMRRRAGIQD